MATVTVIADRVENKRVAILKTSSAYKATLDRRRSGIMVSIAAYEMMDGTVDLQAFNHRGLHDIGPIVSISRDEFEDAPRDPYDDLAYARWALGRCGWSLDGVEGW